MSDVTSRYSSRIVLKPFRKAPGTRIHNLFLACPFSKDPRLAEARMQIAPQPVRISESALTVKINIIRVETYLWNRFDEW